MSSSNGGNSEAVGTSEKKEVVFMRNEFILFLTSLVDVGYLVSFRVTKDKIYVTIKNDRH